MPNIKKKIAMSLEEAEQRLATFAIDALQGDYTELSQWAKSVPISIRVDTSIVKIETARAAALNFISGKINADKFAELLGLLPGEETTKFKTAVTVYRNETS